MFCPWKSLPRPRAPPCPPCGRPAGRLAGWWPHLRAGQKGPPGLGLLVWLISSHLFALLPWTTPQQTQAWASCPPLQTGTLPILFALGHRQGARGSLRKSRRGYSSLNHGCEKRERGQGALSRAGALGADPPATTPFTEPTPPFPRGTFTWSDRTIFSAFHQIFFFSLSLSPAGTW